MHIHTGVGDGRPVRFPVRQLWSFGSVRLRPAKGTRPPCAMAGSGPPPPKGMEKEGGAGGLPEAPLLMRK